MTLFTILLIVLFGSPVFFVLGMMAVFGEWTPYVIAVGVVAYLIVADVLDGGWAHVRRL